MRLVESGGASIAAYDEGEGGPPFLFVHGIACDHTAWRPQVADLSRDHRCVSVDLRGRGASSLAGPYDTTQQADDLASVIRALGLPPVIVVGHSLGGLAALLLNDRHPELVLGVVVGDSPIREGTSLARGLADLAASLTEAGDTEPMRRMVERFATEALPPASREWVMATMLGCPADVAAGMVSNTAVFAERMTELVRGADRKPFMAIWAERPLGDPRWLRDTCGFVRQEPIAGSGHFFQLEEPAITNALLRAFLDDVERDPRVNSG